MLRIRIQNKVHVCISPMEPPCLNWDECLFHRQCCLMQFFCSLGTTCFGNLDTLIRTALCVHPKDKQLMSCYYVQQNCVAFVSQLLSNIVRIQFWSITRKLEGWRKKGIFLCPDFFSSFSYLLKINNNLLKQLCV